MAIISLRAYNREIEGMIDNGQLDESVAHCRHILVTFPKHIATYRLLGKTHLEQQRISDATDIFQRVLSAIPDDFVSNVGMSIIREDENNLDAAIWHMELAYEAQPANIAIQDELRRLYGRRDGMQPPRVRLTRGALARMYAKGGLFDQAIPELRSAITEDPNRPDLQLLLAQMLYQTSQRVDAVDMCMNILKKMPLCLEANRILAISLPDAENSEVVKNSRQLVISMDPYYAFAESEAITSDQVPDTAVNIDRLDYKSGIHVAELPEQPAWATSLGISMEKPADENIPDWLKAVEAPSAGSPPEKPSSGVSPFIWDTQEVEKIITDTSKPEGEIPDWMKDAGWSPSTGQEQPPTPITAQPEEQITPPVVNEQAVQADIPEWLRGIAPDGFAAAQGQQIPGEEEELSNPWLEPHQPGPTDSIIHWLEEEKPVTTSTPAVQKENIVLPPEDEVPDWLKDLDLPQAPEKEGPGLAAPAAAAAFTMGLSAFLDDAEKHEEPVAKAAGIEQPLESATLEFQEQAAVLPPAEIAEPAAVPIEEELPDWLKDIPTSEEVIPEATTTEEPITRLPLQSVETEMAPEAAPSVQEPLPVEASPESKLPEMAGVILAAEMLTKSEEQPTEKQPDMIEKPAEAAPPVILAATTAEVISEGQPPAAIGIEPQVSQEASEIFQPLPVEPEISPTEPEIAAEPEAFAWLKGLTDEQDAQAEQLVVPGPEGEIPPPEWVKLEVEPSTEGTAQVEPVAAVEPQVSPEEEVPEWLKGLGDEAEVEQPPAEATPAVPAETEALQEEELPAWLVEMGQPEPEKEAPVAAEEPLEWEPEELPAWLKEITESEGAEEAAPTPQPSMAEQSHADELAAAAVVAALVHDEAPAQEVTAVEIPPEAIVESQPAAILPEEPAITALPPAPEEVLPPSIAEKEIPTEATEVAPEFPAQEEAVPAVLAADADMANARNAIANGEPSQAITYYSNLIKQNYRLDEIIKDLQDALYRYPVDVDMWVTLGDAHSQTNDLQEALNAYSRAEELVR